MNNQQNFPGFTLNNPSSSDIDAEIASLLFKGNRKSILIATLIALLVIYLQSDKTHVWQSLAWAGLLTGTYLIQTAISIHYKNKATQTTITHWLFAFRAVSGLCGLAWGASSLFFFQFSDYLHQAFLTMSVAGICGGAIVIYALDRYASLSFVTALLVSFLPPFLHSNDALTVSIGLIFLTFVLCITLAGFNLANTLRENIKLRLSSNLREEENVRLAYYDALTDLPNRRLLIDRLSHSLKLSQRSKSCVGVMFIDLDNFKSLNDSKGHAVGDLFLQQVAHRLQKSIRNHDTIARFGGDEFVIVLEEIGADFTIAKSAVDAIARKILKEINKPFKLNQHDHMCSPSIGVYLYTGDNLSVEEVLKRADSAMYQVKQSGRNNFKFYDVSIQPKLDLLATLKSDLALALSHQQLEICFQPQVNSIGKTIGAEALLRWHHPTLGEISPSKFIPLAEETGLIIPIGNWVLQQACLQLKKWSEQAETAHLRLAINVSALQFSQSDFVAQVETAIQLNECDANLLMLELTESLVLKNVNDVVNKMTSLKAMGVLLSLDDFGIGYSSLSLLKQLPLDELKIDRSFVSDALEHPDNAVIIQTIISMGRNLGINVIAEGVAKRAQEDFLKEAGCQTYQGYLFGKPEQIGGFEKTLFLRHNQQQRSEQRLH